MRLATLALMSTVLIATPLLSGCMALHAHIPEDAVRQHMIHEEGVDVAALCSHEGQTYSEGAVTCMSKARMSCSPAGRWVKDGSC